MQLVEAAFKLMGSTFGSAHPDSYLTRSFGRPYPHHFNSLVQLTDAAGDPFIKQATGVV